MTYPAIQKNILNISVKHESACPIFMEKRDRNISERIELVIWCGCYKRGEYILLKKQTPNL